MSPQDLYDIWAPPGALWSDWVKPVLFATMPPVVAPPDQAECPDDAHWEVPKAVSVTGPHALVIDLPGAASVQHGLAVARHGYRPVPLFNAAHGPRAAVPVEAIGAALRGGAEVLRRITLPDNAPPAFLLDAARSGVGPPPQPGDFDNRWLVFPQDFPSASFLRAHGIQGVILVAEGEQPADDLAHVLRRWQMAGLPISLVNPWDAQPPRLIDVQRPLGFRTMWQRMLVLLRLRRSSAGGFGGLVPQPSSGHGFA